MRQPSYSAMKGYKPRELNCGVVHHDRSKETGKNRGAERAAKLILVYYIPSKCSHAGIPPWTPKKKQSRLAPGFSRSPLQLIGCPYGLCSAFANDHARSHRIARRHAWHD